MKPCLTDCVEFQGRASLVKRIGKEIVFAKDNLVFCSSPFSSNRPFSGIFYHKFACSYTIQNVCFVFLSPMYDSDNVENSFENSDIVEEHLLVLDESGAFTLISLSLGFVVQIFKISGISNVVDIIGSSIPGEFSVITKSQIIHCRLGLNPEIISKAQISVSKIQQYHDGFLLLSKGNLFFNQYESVNDFDSNQNIYSFLVDDEKVLIVKKIRNNFGFHVIGGISFGVKGCSIYDFQKGYFCGLCKGAKLVFVNTYNMKQLVVSLKQRPDQNMKYNNIFIFPSKDQKALIVILSNVDAMITISVPLSLLKE
ncbi:hypothetical protein GPJ56_003357 [Histomonas meleagridis]|uniref:uncharacterized protein n=1 Tax=Histomonas meleagridis TaxID=135588 RepID=UPI00355AC762|nr:hypothetical protein GPJ56_003357 [Histomonas meleagridis]KAH0804976.1 hypothetical protein GO595_001921 [Histomonas meleagridis]